jgi:7,8-dihydroneopterin aldolase/epimerase/oxygenase
VSLLATKVFVRGLAVEAAIGVHAHEQGRFQPLILDVELDVEAGDGQALADTVDYSLIVDHAIAIAGGGHIGLVETYARRLADACLGEPRVARVRIRVEKPQALAPRPGVAGVEIIAVRE